MTVRFHHPSDEIFRPLQEPAKLRAVALAETAGDPLFEAVAVGKKENGKVIAMGRGILLWLIGVPIPIIILLAIFFHH